MKGVHRINIDPHPSSTVLFRPPIELFYIGQYIKIPPGRVIILVRIGVLRNARAQLSCNLHLNDLTELTPASSKASRNAASSSLSSISHPPLGNTHLFWSL